MKFLGALGLLACFSSACVMGDGYEDFGFAAAGESFAAGQDIPKDQLLAFAGNYVDKQTNDHFVLMPRRHSPAIQQQPVTSLAVHRMAFGGVANAQPLSLGDDTFTPFLKITAVADGATTITLTYGDAAAPVTRQLARSNAMAATTVYSELQLLAESAAKVIYSRQAPVDMFVSVANFDSAKTAQIANAMKLVADNAAKLNQLNVTAVNASTNPDQTGGKFLVPGAAGATLYINAASSPTTFMGLVTPPAPGTPQTPTVPTPRIPGPQPQNQGKVTNDDDGCSSGGQSGAFLGFALAIMAVTARRRRIFT